MSAPADLVGGVDELAADFIWVVYHDYSGLGRAKAITRERLPEVAFEMGLAETVAWYKANGEWVENIKTKDYLGDYERQYGTRA